MPRRALVDRLLAVSKVPVISVVAPPGYGKTTLLGQWLEQVDRPVAWLSIDEADDDPTVLLTYVAAALDRAEVSDGDVLLAQAMPGEAVAAVVGRRVAALLAAMGESGALVLDRTERLTNVHCRDAVAQLAMHLPLGWQLVVVCRERPPLPLAPLRSRGAVIEIGVDDLAMDRREAGALLNSQGRSVADVDIDGLMHRTEGWPVALYLATLALRADHPMNRPGFTFTGDDRFMADYLQSELLSRLSPDTLVFLTRTSALDQMSGALCDAVLGVEGSGPLLEWLDRSNLLLVPLDRHRRWYRYHRLFRDLLLAELERSEPELVARLPSRAAAWFEARGMFDKAIEHEQASGDADRVARLVTRLVLQNHGSGSVAARSWFQWFDDHGLVQEHTSIAVLGAVTFAFLGEPAATERWAAAAERAAADETLPDGSTVTSWRAGLRALLCRNGTSAMRHDAEIARQGSAPGSPWRATTLMALGLSYMLEDQADRADPILAHATNVAVDVHATLIAAIGLAERALAAAERQDWRAADLLAQRALRLAEERNIDRIGLSALVYAVAARTAVRRGDLAETRANLARTTRLRPALSYAIPSLAVQTLVELASVNVALHDGAGARSVLQEARDILRVRPNLGALPRRVGELWSKLGVNGLSVGAWALTTAEMRLVPLLSTHLSFREIGERLYLSRHTVKTQAMSIYRKVGASSRSEAITLMEEVGLLGD